MYKLTFLLVTILLKNANSNILEEEFIDMLSKEDKERVLRNIEGRITNDVNSTERPLKAEVELSDKDVDKHTDYVVKVLREAAETFMNTDSETTEPIKLLTTVKAKKVVRRKQVVAESNKPIVLLNITTLTEPRVKKVSLTRNITKVKNESKIVNLTKENNTNILRSRISEEEKRQEYEEKEREDLIEKLNDDLKKLDPTAIYEIGSETVTKEIASNKPIPIYKYDVQNAYFNPKSRFQTVGYTPVAKNLDYEINLYEPRQMSRTSEFYEPQGDPIAIDYFSGRQQSEEWIWSRTEKITNKKNEYDILLEVIKDMFERDNEYLLRYDWLGSTVDVLAALAKIIRYFKYGSEKNITTLDINLLNYIKHIYVESKPKLNEALSPMDNEQFYPKFLNKLAKTYYRNFKLHWEEFSVGRADNDILNFFIKLETTLSPLHRHINKMAAESTFQNQNWFKTIKKRVSTQYDREETLRILLHIYTANFLDLVEKNYKKNDEIKNDAEVLKQIIQILNQF